MYTNICIKGTWECRFWFFSMRPSVWFSMMWYRCKYNIYCVIIPDVLILLCTFSSAFLPFMFSTIWTLIFYLPVSHLFPPRLFSLCPSSEIFVHGDLQWDIFQVIISRSTTPDLIKIGMKLQEFFTQQFDTSKRALSTWGPGPYLPPKTPVINTEKGAAELCKQDFFYTARWDV